MKAFRRPDVSHQRGAERPASASALPEGVGAGHIADVDGKLALLLLLGGDIVDEHIAILRSRGAAEPTEDDYLRLAHEGLVTRGPKSGAWMLSPTGRRTVGGIALDIGHATGAHRPIVGINRNERKAYFRCTCGLHFEQSLEVRGAYYHVRCRYDQHVTSIRRRLEQAPIASGTTEDAILLMSASMQAYIAATSGGKR